MPLVEGSIRLPGPTASSEASGSVSSAHPHANPGVRVGPEPTSQSGWPRPQRRGWWCGSLTSQQGWGEEGLPALAEATVHPPPTFPPPCSLPAGSAGRCAGPLCGMLQDGCLSRGPRPAAVSLCVQPRPCSHHQDRCQERLRSGGHWPPEERRWDRPGECRGHYQPAPPQQCRWAP